jgi:hypothetical protein
MLNFVERQEKKSERKKHVRELGVNGRILKWILFKIMR